MKFAFLIKIKYNQKIIFLLRNYVSINSCAKQDNLEEIIRLILRKGEVETVEGSCLCGYKTARFSEEKHEKNHGEGGKVKIFEYPE